MFVNHALKLHVVTCFFRSFSPEDQNERAPGRHICNDVMSNLPVSFVRPVFEFECWLQSGFSIKGCKSVISSAVPYAHRSNVRYCYYSSLVNQRARDQTISHHTRWKLNRLNMSWVTQTYSTTFSYFGDECMEVFFLPLPFSLHCWWSEFMKRAFLCCTRTQLHLLAWEVENGLKRNERFAEECTEVESNEDFYCLHVFYNKRWRR